MIIKSNVYHAIVNNVPNVPPEVGVILGGSDGIISCYYIDYGIPSNKIGCYTPHIQKLNAILNTWNKHNLDFIGFAHTHHSNSCCLSSGDRVYIRNIMKSLQGSLDALLFPVIIPKETIIGYIARYYNPRLHIENDTITIID